MNILLFAIAMLLLLATMTYAKLDSFRSEQRSQIQFEHYLKQSDRNYLSKKAEDWYESVKVSTQNAPSGPKQQAGRSTLSFFPLLDSGEREKDPGKAREVMDLTKNLIIHLFAAQPNVQKMLETNPDLIDRFFASLIASIDKLPAKNRIKKIHELSSIELDDEEIKNFRYEIFKENKVIGPNNTETTYSLLDELTALPVKTNLYLASKNILQALLHKNPAAADQIIQKRLFYYKAVINKKNPMDPAEASAQFKAFVETFSPYLNDSLFDCLVTKTKPTKNE